MRLMIYDKTDRKSGLSHAWFIGGALYERLRWLDTCEGFDNWIDALRWAIDLSVKKQKLITQIQYWGHGAPGIVAMNGQYLSAIGRKAPSQLAMGPHLIELLDELRWRLAPKALLWFRTCGTFAGETGQDFATSWSQFLGCRVAGHTHVIGFLQSGLHSVNVGGKPTWSPSEGILDDKPFIPTVEWSGWRKPNTITCLRGTLPDGW